MENEWQIETGYASQGKFKKFASRHPREYDSMFANLDKILRLLRSGNKIGGFQTSFFRSEGEGVFRIGQSAVAHAKESRLYVFFNEPDHICHILAIGDKDSQSVDINEAKRTAKMIKTNKI